MATNGVDPEMAAAESEGHSGGGKLINEGLFIGLRYRTLRA
jgi:hypothetical protein